MHEEALLRDLVRKVEEVARTHRSERVTRIRLWVGAFAHLSPPQLRDRWTTAAAGTAAERAELEIEFSHDTSDPRATGVVLVSVDAEPPR